MMNDSLLELQIGEAQLAQCHQTTPVLAKQNRTSEITIVQPSFLHAFQQTPFDTNG